MIPCLYGVATPDFLEVCSTVLALWVAPNGVTDATISQMLCPQVLIEEIFGGKDLSTVQANGSGAARCDHVLSSKQ